MFHFNLNKGIKYYPKDKTINNIRHHESCLTIFGLRDKIIKDVKQRVVGVRGLLGKKIEFESCQEALIKGFKKALRLEYLKTSLTASELIMMQELKNSKYSRPEWNLMR